MQSETKICQKCKNDFVIEPDDFNFYEKIKVPPPTFCFTCRIMRRLCWRNEMSLFKRKCDAPGHDETLISLYPPDEKLVVYDSKYWWSDSWDPLSYGKEYDFTQPFFLQWKELRDNFPLQILSNSKAVNSDYCNVAEDSKNSYMCSGSWRIEQCFYSNRVTAIKDCSDLYVAHDSELCYDGILYSNCYHVLYSINCKNCVDSYFLYDCVGCVNCFGCSNLRNKSYCMWNEQLSKEEYSEELSKLNLKSFREIEKNKNKFSELCLKSIHRFSTQVKTVDSTGDNLEEVKNCHYCFDASNGPIEDCKYSHWMESKVKDGYDAGPGVGLAELVYEVFDTGIGNSRNLFTSVVYSSNDIEYSFNCHGCSNLFGCIGLRNKKYCILNKQYDKEEYNSITPKIKQQMMEIPYIDKNGILYKYGEFFPSELSPFCYNETQAQDYFPMTREEALERGYKWRDKKPNNYEITVKADNLQDDFNDIDDSITDEVIECAHKGKCSHRCSLAFKIIPDELSMYKKIGVPIPRLCFFCRHEERLSKRNPLKLWHRKCMHDGCNNEFETSYAPERPEIIYCERCYQQEVY